MRLRRILALAATFAVLASVAIAVLVIMNQDRIVNAVLRRLKDRTGVEISATHGSLALGDHLIMRLQNLRMASGGREIAKAARLQAVISFRALFSGSGLPLVALIVDQPAVIFRRQTEPGAAAIPHFDRATARAITGAARRLSSLSRRIEIIDGSLIGANGAHLIDHLDFKAHSRRHLTASPLWVRFGFTWNGDPGSGSEFSGDFRFDTAPRESSAAVAKGHLWVWGVSMDRLDVRALTATGTLRGDMSLVIDAHGSASGSIAVAARALALGGKQSLAAADYSLSATFNASPDRIQLNDLNLRQENIPAMRGAVRIDAPYEADPHVNLQLSGMQADFGTIKRLINSSPTRLPAWMAGVANRIESGRLRLDEIALDSSVADLKAMNPSLLRNLSIVARLERAAFTMPAEANLPPLHDATAAVACEHGLITITQGQLRAGRSELSNFNLRADFSANIDNAPYQVRGSGVADLNDLYSLVAGQVRKMGRDPGEFVGGLDGLADFDLRASGQLDGWSLPSDYAGTIAPHNVRVILKDPAVTVTAVRGSVGVNPSRLKLDKLALALNPGSVLLSGEMAFGRGALKLRDLVVELQKVPAHRWLPMAAPADTISARGDVSGRVVANVDLARPSDFKLKGALTMGPGEIQFGFLRSPILVQAAMLTLAGQDVLLEMPSSTLEGQALDMKVGVTDLRNPVLRIDAVVQRLELEALKFVRLPWTPKTNAVLPGTRASGHVEVRKGNFAALPLSALRTDFSRNGGDWRVYNLHATSLGGRVDLEIAGRAADDWIQIKGRVTGMDAGALMVTAGQDRPVLLGKIYGNFDLWGNTNTDFFDTLAGKMSVAVKNGRLERFTLLSRVLGLIDLKNWLSAQVPDPRLSGLPFDYINTSFAGHEGSFYTDDFLLDGPVMDITGSGEVDVGNASLDMELGVLPFQSVRWLLSKIPLVGKDLSLTSGAILAGYFHVHGKVSDPGVTPMPITSAAELVKKTLALPINILRPNTVK